MLFDKLRHIEERSNEIARALSDPAIFGQPNEYARLRKEHAETVEIVERFTAYRDVLRRLGEARHILDEGGDKELIELAQAEIDELAGKQGALEEELKKLLLPRDPNDDKNLFLEIRAGTGGDESALFAADLARMYLRYAERRRWKTEILSESASDLGGYKELVVRIEGDLVYAALKFESGGHRVQRVPATETQGRIHTSACTIAVLPEPDAAEEITLDPSELRIDTFRASGAGGQHVNKTDSAIRITHLPTGIVA